MNKKEHFSVNFSLKGFTSIQIGLYFVLTSYFIKSILDGFLIDDNAMGMLSAQIIEYLVIAIGVLLFLFSSFALFFSARRRAKKEDFALWNPLSKILLQKYVVCFTTLFIVLLVVMNQGFIDLIAPIFLFLYALILLLLHQRNNKNIRVIAGLCILLGIICFLVPSYWYASLSILGIAHMTFGVVIKI